MAKSDFEKLEVYQLAEKLADQVWAVVRGWPAFPRRVVGEQLTCAADSVGANIVEGVGRGSFADNRRFVRIARGSLYETKYWLRRAFARGLLTKTDVSKLRPLMDELLPRLNAYLRSIGNVPSARRRTMDH